MVRKSKYRKYKKAYKKYKKLTNRNIYGHKSAKSQAVQIAALRNKIKRVQKMCMPDIVQAVSYGYKLFSNQDFSTINNTYCQFLCMPGVAPFYNVDSYTGTYPPTVGDNTMYIMGGYYRINCIYSNNYSNANDIGQCERNANVRVIFLRRKACFNPNPNNTNPASYLDGYATSGQDYVINHLKGFREGVATECEILYDKWKTINEHKPQCTFKVKIPKVHQTYMNNVSYPKNALYGFIIVNGLMYGGSSHSALVANVNTIAIAKLCYSSNSVDAT